MKKVVLFAVAAIAVSLASCSNKQNAETSSDVDTTAVVETVEETVAPEASADSAQVTDEVATEVVETPAN